MRHEAILEAEFLQRFHVYTARELFKYLPQFMSPTLMQQFLAQQSAITIELHGNHLYMLFTQRELANTNRLTKHLDGFCNLANQIDDQSRQLNHGLHQQPSGQLPARRGRSLQLSSMVIRGWWFKVLFTMLLAGLLLQSIFMDDGANLNNVMLQVTLLAILLVFLAYGPMTKSVYQKRWWHRQVGPKDEVIT
jgi:hypothetical protein